MSLLLKFGRQISGLELFAARAYERYTTLKQININGVPMFDVPTWLENNRFIESGDTKTKGNTLWFITKRGLEYFDILESAYDPPVNRWQSTKMYFSSNLKEKNNPNDPSYLRPVVYDCALYEDYIERDIGLYLNPKNVEFNHKWASYDGKEHKRK